MYRHVVFRCTNRRAGLRRINLGSAVGFSGQECKSPATPQILRTNDWQINGAQFLFTPVGAFRQHNSGDCFFLVSVLALINDADGRLLVENSLAETPEAGTVKVIFPNQPDLPIIVGTKFAPPFIMGSREAPNGLAVAFWEMIAGCLGLGPSEAETF